MPRQPHPEWRRVSRQTPCPICERPDWCLIAADGSAAICPRIESPHRVGEAGYLHRLIDDRDKPEGKPTRKPRRLRVPHRTDHAEADFSDLADRYHRAAVEHGQLARLAERLEVSEQSLARLGVGWLSAEHCWTFPIHDAAGERIVGINRRFPDNKKLLRRGDRTGLYMPRDLPRDLSGDQLLIVEGGSDTAAALDLGQWAVGRFACQHNTRGLVHLVQQRRPGEVAIVADADGPGRRGAEALASVLVTYAVRLRLIEPPRGDLRGWLNAGATADDLRELIEAAPARGMKVRVRV